MNGTAAGLFAGLPDRHLMIGEAMSYLSVACQTLLLGVFVVALVGKIRRREARREFVASIRMLDVVPRRWAGVAASAVMAAEAAVVLMLAVPFTVPAGFGLTVVLLAVFTTGILLALRRGKRVPCRCFGTSSTPLGVVHVVRNLFLVLVGGVGFFATGVAGQAPHPAGVLLAVAAAGLTLVPVLRLDDLMTLFRPTALRAVAAGRENPR